MGLRLPPIRNPFAHRENYEDAAGAIGDFFDPRPLISDVYWAATHPIDNLRGRGRAANPIMAIPLGGRWAPKTPGLRAEAAGRGDIIRNHRGQHDLQGSDITHGMRSYNLRNEQDEIVGSLTGGRMDRKSTFIDSMFVDERYRKTPAMMDLLRLGTREGKLQPHGAIANPRLFKVLKRRFDPERAKVLDAVEKVKKTAAPRAKRASAERRGLAEHTQWGAPKTPLKNPSLSKPIPRQETVALAIALRQERLAKAQGRQPTTKQLIEGSRARDAEAAARQQAAHARMETALGLAHRFNSRRRGGV